MLLLNRVGSQLIVFSSVCFRTVQCNQTVDRLFERGVDARNLISIMITNWRRSTQQWPSLVNPHHRLCYGLDYCEGWILFHMHGAAACAMRANKMMTYYWPTQRGCLWAKHSTLYKGCTFETVGRWEKRNCFVAGVQPPKTLSAKSETTPTSVESNNETRSFCLYDMTKAGIFLLRCPQQL